MSKRKLLPKVKKENLLPKTKKLFSHTLKRNGCGMEKKMVFTLRMSSKIGIRSMIKPRLKIIQRLGIERRVLNTV